MTKDKRLKQEYDKNNCTSIEDKIFYLETKHNMRLFTYANNIDNEQESKYDLIALEAIDSYLNKIR